MVTKRIYKYQVSVDDQDHYVTMPPESTIVHVSTQGAVIDIVNFWAEHVEQVTPQVTRAFRVFGTGHEIPGDYEYVGTTLTASPLVWHLYERQPS